MSDNITPSMTKPQPHISSITFNNNMPILTHKTLKAQIGVKFVNLSGTSLDLPILPQYSGYFDF